MVTFYSYSIEALRALPSEQFGHLFSNASPYGSLAILPVCVCVALLVFAIIRGFKK